MRPQKKQFVFWQNIPSFHQSAFIRTLASREDCDITLVVQEELPNSFKEDGWAVPDFGLAHVIIPRNDAEVLELFSRSNKDTIHIFSGIRFPLVRTAFLKAVKTNAPIGLLAEAADWRGIKGIGRTLLYRFEFLRLRSRIDFILAMGELGIKWYSMCGIPSDKIYPFAYVVEKPANQGQILSRQEGVLLVFVGQCIRRKGVDTLLAALNNLRGMDWHLDIVGDGPERDNLMRQAKVSGIANKVSFHGSIENDAARNIIAQADVFVLPSRWDGWGAVVNEALMMGVPVVCSDLCGAADLLTNPDCGEVFKAGSDTELQKVLDRWISKGKRRQETTDRIKSWSKSIEGGTVASYLLDVIDAAVGIKNRPHVPWRNRGQPCA